MGTLNLLPGGSIRADNYQLANGQELGKCYAWVNFNGTGVVAIRKSLNISSITDGGTGTYTLNLTTPLPDTNGAVVANSSTVGSSTLSWQTTVEILTTSTVRVNTPVAGSAANTLEDRNYNSVSIFN